MCVCVCLCTCLESVRAPLAEKALVWAYPLAPGSATIKRCIFSYSSLSFSMKSDAPIPVSVTGFERLKMDLWVAIPV